MTRKDGGTIGKDRISEKTRNDKETQTKLDGELNCSLN